MCAIRRELSDVVKYCLPSSCWPANTSHKRNSAFSLPSVCLVMRPVTSACALMTRQSAKRGTVSELVIFSVKAVGLIGANRPLRCRLPEMIAVTLRATSDSVGEPATNSGKAIGIGCGLPWVISSRSAAEAGRAATAARAPAPAPTRKRRRFNASLLMFIVFSPECHCTSCCCRRRSRFPARSHNDLAAASYRAGRPAPRAPRCRAWH